MMNISLNQVILFVQDVERLKGFYQQHFGLGITEEIANEWVVLKTGNCEIGLHKANGKGGGEHSNVKLVFAIDGDIYLLREQLIQAGAVMRNVTNFGTADRLYCDGKDLEGNVFQLMQRV